VFRELSATSYAGYDEDDFPVVSHDSYAADPSKRGSVSAFELHHPFGFASFPRDPDVDDDKLPIPGKACDVWVEDVGEDTHGHLGRDPRFMGGVPKLTGGSSCQYAATGSFLLLDGSVDDGTMTLYVPLPGDEKAHVVTVGKDATGKASLGLVHCDGMAIMMLDGKLVMKNADGSSYYELGAGGHVLSGNALVNGGLIAGNPAAAQPLVNHTVLATLLLVLGAALDAGFEGKAGARPAVPFATLLSTAATQTAATTLIKGI
jgi:hypothetical protein